MKRLTEIEQHGGRPLYQLKVTLKWSKPPIWRRVIVSADIRLDRLHTVIQVIMGWTNSHLHQFAVGRTFYGRPDPEVADMGSEVLNEEHDTVAERESVAIETFV